MVTVSLLDRTRTRDRARPRPSAAGNFITASFFATVYSLTFTPTPQHYIKWWPYVFPETKAIGYVDNPAIVPPWVAVGPVNDIAIIPNITGSILPSNAGLPPVQVPDLGIPIPAIGNLGNPTPVTVEPVVTPNVLPQTTPAGAQLTAQTANKPGQTFSKTVGTSAIQLFGTTLPTRGVTILNDPDNAGDIWVGYDSQVLVNNGFRLIPGAAKDFNIDDVSAIWLVASVAAQIVHVEYTK